MWPIRVFWEGVLTAAQPGDVLFPSLIRSNINRILKATLRRAGVSGGGRYSAHCFRRGAADELLRPGPSLATITKAGGWTSGGYKVYLDLHAEEGNQIRTISQRPPPLPRLRRGKYAIRIIDQEARIIFFSLTR